MMIRFFIFSSRRRHTRYWRDWSSDVCSSDLGRRRGARRGWGRDVAGGAQTGRPGLRPRPGGALPDPLGRAAAPDDGGEIGRASWSERVKILVVDVSLKKKYLLLIVSYAYHRY